MAQAGIGAATGGLGGLALAGATGTKSKNWGQVLGKGIVGGLVGGGIQNALMGQGGGAGGQLYQSWFGGGAAPTSPIAKGAQAVARGAGSLLSGGAGTLGNLALLSGLYGSLRGAKVANEAGQLTPEEQAAQGSMGELRQQLLQQLGEGQDVEPFIEEMYQTQEPRYAASMFKRGLQGSTAYGVGLADLARRSYLGGENIRSQRQGQQWRGLNILGNQLGGLSAQQRAGQLGYAQSLAGLGDIGQDLWAMQYLNAQKPVNEGLPRSLIPLPFGTSSQGPGSRRIADLVSQQVPPVAIGRGGTPVQAPPFDPYGQIQYDPDSYLGLNNL